MLATKIMWQVKIYVQALLLEQAKDCIGITLTRLELLHEKLFNRRMKFG